MEYTMETTYKTHMIVLYQAHMTFCFNPVFRFENQNATNATIDITMAEITPGTPRDQKNNRIRTGGAINMNIGIMMISPTALVMGLSSS